MTVIRLQFSAERDSSSALIEWFSAGRFAHVDAVVEGTFAASLLASPEGSLLGARLAGGVAVRPRDYANFTRKLIVEIPCSVWQAKRFWTFLQRQVGKRYDWTAIVAFALYRDWRSAVRWFCSELIAAALEFALVFAHRLYRRASKIVPEDLLEVLSVIVDVLPRLVVP